MRISFDLYEFRKWLEKVNSLFEGIEKFYIKNDDVIYWWESNINGVIERNEEIDLYGALEDD